MSFFRSCFSGGLLLMIVSLCIWGCANAPDRVSSPLSSLLDRIVDWEESRSPLAVLYDGRHAQTIDPLRLEDFAIARDQAVSFRAELLAIDDTVLPAGERLSRQVMLFKLTDIVDRLEFGEHLIPINAEGGFYNSLISLTRRLPFATAGDYDAFLGWLPQYADYLRSYLPILEEGIARGRVAPAVVVENTLKMLQPLAQARFDDHPAMHPFASMPMAIEAQHGQRLREEAVVIFEDALQPAYQSLYQFFASTYRPVAPARPGLLAQPGGAAHYENRVRFFTTLPLTPDAVFELGLREVTRIESAMDRVRNDLGFQGGRKEFIEHLRTAPEHYAESGQALLERAAWIAKTIEGKLPRWFDPLYELPFTVQPVPANIAPTYTSGRYVSGDSQQDRPGIYWVNTTALRSRALFNLPALTLHEAVPGHHLQHARASELVSVHPFRNNYYISAFGEGWGLYAEYLGEEMGIYQTPYERFGRLSYEMWRACRLVVDVGIHYRGWSRAQAIDYLGSRTALSELEVENEIDRYIGWPGQALAYKLGELTIIGLRREAEQALGARFDVKAFHEAVLGQGALPLQGLVDQVRNSLGLPGTGLPAGISQIP